MREHRCLEKRARTGRERSIVRIVHSTRRFIADPRIHTATRDWNSWNANYFNRPVDESLPSDRISIFRGKRCVIPFITKETREFFFLMGWYFEWVDRYEIMYPLLFESRKIDEIFPCLPCLSRATIISFYGKLDSVKFFYRWN